ncbi:hypothetical protein [Arthrobacter woluwensis]|uniref:hypothetical protein n=1 Tax=Arthrobacter woluwensis TaxID=156980 RepID=UPI001AAEE41F|nr:hypothetical protein [Arthrobacter woluwensis]QTF70616.1 hypothetical protein G8758_00250 [Arthrobacter woluwensis]
MAGFDAVPWMINDGPRHPGEVGRGLAYAATNGAEGVSGVGDLKVTAQPVPNGSVQIMPGGALLLNRYQGGAGQTYSLRCGTAATLQISPTGSSGGRNDLVIARILDPQYDPEYKNAAPPDPATFQYAYPTVIEGVAANATVKSLGLGYPAIDLSRIALPANTGTVTPAMITDLRRIAQPRRDHNMFAVFPAANNNIPTNGYGPSWPITAGQRPSLYIPTWATALTVVVTMSGIKYTKGNTSTDTVAGIRTAFGSGSTWNYAENGILIQDAEDTGGRYPCLLIGKHTIPASWRGTTQILDLQATRSSGSGIWTADYQTQVGIDIEFEETAA